MKTYEDVLNVVKACWHLDIEAYWWVDSTKEDEVKCAINCNDFFYWACSDAVDLEVEDLPLLQQTYDDLKALETLECPILIDNVELLYCARKRMMRPQGAFYKYLPKETWTLFNACGPHRKENVANPVETPEEE